MSITHGSQSGGTVKKVTHDIAQLMEMLTDLNSIGALDGLVFAVVRSSGEAPLHGRVCGEGRSYELLGAGHAALFALTDSIDGSATIIGDDSPDPEAT